MQLRHTNLDMWGLLGNLFGGVKAGEKIIDGVSNGIDKMFYTDEEKADDGAKARSEGMTVYMEWLRSTSGSRLARRLLSLGTFSIWSVEHIAAMGFKLAYIWIPTEQLLAAGKLMTEQANNDNSIMGVVLLFYFGGPVAADAITGLVTKWVGKK